MNDDYSPGLVVAKLGVLVVVLHLFLTVAGVLIALWIWQ